MPIGFYVTDKGKEERNKLYAIRNFLNDFSIINEREIPEVTLWERYLVFATAFGIGEKVLKSMQIKLENQQVEVLSSNLLLDGYICNEKNIATLVTTADCNPIIIYDFKKNIYANVHSGWKGTIKQIYLKAAKLMNEKFGCNFEDMIVCVGPSIKKCCFSSEDESFKKKFTDVWKYENEYIYYEENSKRFHIDLGYVIKKDLINLGVKEENIIIPDICTKCNCDMFFSYREATNKKYSDYGTMATIVTLI